MITVVFFKSLIDRSNHSYVSEEVIVRKYQQSINNQ